MRRVKEATPSRSGSHHKGAGKRRATRWITSAMSLTARRRCLQPTTLFSIGCGRVFEGPIPDGGTRCSSCGALPDDFKLYCAMNTPQPSVKFALTVEPDNAALRARAEQVTRLRADTSRLSRRCWRREEGQRIPARRRTVGRGRRTAERQGCCRECSANCANAEQVLMGSVPTAAEIIARLELKPHPKAGTIAETFRDSRRDVDGRSASTAIYFLLARGERSHWHRDRRREVFGIIRRQRAESANCR